MSEVVIIWPEAVHLARLNDALANHVPGAAPRLIDHYPDPSELASLFGTASEGAVVVGLDGTKAGVRTLEALRGLAPGLKPIAAAADLDASSVRAAMRVGAVEFLTPPFDADELKRAFSDGGDRQGRGLGQVAGFVPARMGDGASTIALHAAVNISRDLSQPAMLIDCDFECGTTAFRMGRNPPYTIIDAIARLDVLDDIWDQLAAEWNCAHVLLAPDRGPMLGDLQLDAVGEIVRAAASRYPFVCVDFPAALYPACGAVLAACDVVHVVCTPDLTSLHLARRRLQRLIDVGTSLDLVRVVVNRGGSRHALPTSKIEEVLRAPIACTLPNDYDSASEAALKSDAVSSGSRLGKALKEFSAEMAGLEVAGEDGSSGGWTKFLRF